MAKLGVFIHFDGNCNDALKFYAKVFGTTTGMIMRYGDAPGIDAMGFEDRITYSDMMIGSENVMFSDMPPQDKHVVGNNFALSYSDTDQDKLHNIFTQLSEGGNVIMPMGKTFFSELYGMVTDKFGITWNIMV